MLKPKLGAKNYVRQNWGLEKNSSFLALSRGFFHNKNYY